MNKDGNNLVLDILKKKWIFLVTLIALIAGAVYLLIFIQDPIKAPIPNLISNMNLEKQLNEEIKNKKANLERILADNKAKNEAAKKATVKDFYKIDMPSGDVTNDFAPLLENIITMLKQNGLRMKSIKYTGSGSLQDDNLIKNGDGTYTGCQVDLELVGYYPQFAAFLNELGDYPYFINISELKVVPYQYDKRILISNLSIIFYSKTR